MHVAIGQGAVEVWRRLSVDLGMRHFTEDVLGYYLKEGQICLEIRINCGQVRNASVLSTDVQSREDWRSYLCPTTSF